MGKKKREEKLKKKLLAEWEAKRPKTLRQALPYLPGLFLRTLLVIMGLTLAMALLSLAGLTFFTNFWVQMGVYLVGYLLLQRFILGPLAPPRVK
ncbi:hypothetical protein [Thermus filiformis]|uniref:Uncharacterized protein n=1 Tax=Thermus filiformis TaxID=276 RepID=A0A0A2X885_THEFI|nr:hypothetical protein [Thermus filiformis]KGQ21444.2 hypothetical protein THFILI_06435 [Thermus filiformis]